MTAGEITILRRDQRDAERMAKLSPFAMDRLRFQRIAAEYEARADALERRPAN